MHVNNRYRRLFLSACWLTLFIFEGVPALAVQQHGDPEGLVAHQIGHMLFIAGMLILLVRIYYNKLRGPGWREFQGFLWLVILWNIVTFASHWLFIGTDPRLFHFQENHIVSFSVHTFRDLVFYISRLDHLFLVPSFLLLLLALLKWRRSA